MVISRFCLFLFGAIRNAVIFALRFFDCPAIDALAENNRKYKVQDSDHLVPIF